MNRIIMLMFSIALAACGGASAPPAPPEEADPAPSLLTGTEDDGVADVADIAGSGDSVDGEFAIEGYGPGPTVAAALPAEHDAPDSGTRAGAERHTLYVSPNGADSNPGTASRPFRSIARAARSASAGMRVLVAPGTYQGGLRTVASGNAQARISYVSARKWGAKVVPPKNAPGKAAWDNRGSYVDVTGFEIDGSNYRGGKRWTLGIYSGGSYDVIRNNHVHHIAQGAPCNPAGGAAIGVDSYYGGVMADVIANLVHDIGPAGCRFVQGIYVSTSGRVKNNVVYRVAEGGIHLWHDARDVTITNNTVTASNTGIIVGGGNFYRTRGPNDHTAVYSNIVFDNRMGISEQGKTGRNNSYRNNLVFRNSSYDWRLRNNLGHSATVSAAPGFVADARAGRPDLRLAPSSPAIGRASALMAESTDFEGKPRNAGAGFDIGAFQH